VTGFLSDGLAGLTYALAGAFCTGTPIALKRHFEGEVSRSKLRIEDEIREMETRIKETREAVACIAPAVARLRDRHGNAGAAAGPVPHQSQTLKHSQAAKLVSLSSGQEETSPVSRVTGAEESPPAPAEREIVGAGTVGTETVGTEPVTAENVSEEDVATEHDAVPGGNAASIDEAPDEDGTGTESESSESIEDIMLRVSGLSGDPSSAGSDGGSPSEEHGDSEDSETGEDRDPADQARTKSEEETGSPAGSPRRRRSPPRPTWLSETDLLRQCLERLRELELAERLEEWVNRTRPELVEMRHHLRDLQRDFGTARQDWCSHLVEHGLQETVDIDAAIIQRDQVGRAALLLQQIDALQEETQVARRMSERFRKRIEELGHRLQQWDVDYSDPLGVLDQWSQQLARHADVTRRRRELKREARQRRIEASKYRGQIRRLESQRDAILVRGGAVSREEFEDRAALLEKRFELQERLNHAKQELADVSSSQGTMAVVQTDLEKYDAEHNAKCIETIRQELDDLAIDIEDAFENLGRFKREVELLENDSTSAELRFEREQQLSELTSLAEEWFALAWSVDTLEELRIEFERNHQPPVLARAKEYLNRISRGRYQNIWTPLGQRTLCVDDSEGNTLTVEYLSGGTREQLFLSIRFALVEHFCEQGVELPIILDDVLVNFDEDRTRAAIEELLQKTAEHRQILYFTCHQHLAEMFRQRGISTVTLPDRRSLADHDNELMAG